MTDFVAGCAGHKDIDMMDVLHEVIADIQHSYALAMEMHSRVDDDAAHVITSTVNDYIVNNYGED